jgi:hypothetical protein
MEQFDWKYRPNNIEAVKGARMRKVPMIVLIFLTIFGAGGCILASSASKENQGWPLVTSTVEMTPDQRSPSIPFPSATIDPSTHLPAGLQDLIARAKEDLADQLSIRKDQISLVETIEVTWPDSSLGCPQKGVSYLQVLTPGYKIILEAGGNQYEYHSDESIQLISCPVQPAPIPGNSVNP